MRLEPDGAKCVGMCLGGATYHYSLRSDRRDGRLVQKHSVRVQQEKKQSSSWREEGGSFRSGILLELKNCSKIVLTNSLLFLRQ